MKHKYWNSLLVAIFFILSAIVLLVGTRYKSLETAAFSSQQYQKTANALTDKLKTLIAEKRNATLTIGLTLAQDSLLKTILEKKEHSKVHLAQFSKKLREQTDFKNVWMQLIDNHDIVLSRSWNDKKGDTLKCVLPDRLSQKSTTLIAVDNYDLHFKAVVPIFSNKDKYIGRLETLTHFNSIDKKIQAEGFQSLFLVDKRYKKQLTDPFTATFAGDYYIANKNADSELIAYVNQHGIEKLLAQKSAYSIDAKGKYFIVYHTLYDDNNQAMAYVLMFQKIEYVDTSSIDSIKSIVNLFMIITIIVLGFFLMLLAYSKSIHNEKEIKIFKYFFIFVAIFVITVMIYYLLIDLYKRNEQKDYLTAYNANIEKDYQIINKKFAAVADVIFETSLHNQTVNDLMSQAYGPAKDTARQKLYLLLKEKYEHFKKYGLRQLHFHLKNNESFLRFHRPEKFGDNLTGIRATVAWVNENHTKIEGFEEGRIYNGFRYVFPLTNKADNEHLGSVEISFSAHAIAQEFANSHNTKAGLLIYKDVVQKKIFNEELRNYSKSRWKDFYYEKAIKKQLESHMMHIESEKISDEDIQSSNRKIFDGKAFSVGSQNGKALFTFLPLKNPVTKKVVGTIVLQVENRILEQQSGFFSLLFSVGAILILLIILFIFREFTLKLKFFELSLKTQHILDTQKSIVLITNGEELFEVNKKFLEFFHFDSLEDFKVEHKCVCGLFIKNDNYFHLGKVPQNISWVHYLEQVTDKDRIVLIKNVESGKDHSFTVAFSQYKHEYYIVTFTDISHTMQEQFTLEKKVIHDKLTGSFNREFFDKNAAKIIAQNDEEGTFLGVIFFDIDHFKEVNDTYGHNLGDTILKELVTCVKQSIRKSDYLIRWGGEEFIVLVSVESIEEVGSIAEHLRATIEHYPFSEVGVITCSFGASLYRDQEVIKNTIERADQALYISKKEGRNRVTLK